MLSRSRLRDDTGLSHLFRQKALPQHIVDLMRTGMIQVLSFQVNLCTAQIFGHLLCVIQKRRPAGIVFQKILQLRLKLRILFIVFILLFQMNDLIHQCFRNILSSMDSKSTFLHFLSS